MTERVMPEMRMAEKMILLAFGLAILFWIVESIMGAFAFHRCSFKIHADGAQPPAGSVKVRDAQII